MATTNHIPSTCVEIGHEHQELRDPFSNVGGSTGDKGGMCGLSKALKKCTT